MTVTYGHIAHGDGDPLLARSYELANIAKRIITPEKAALLTAFPFRECLSTIKHRFKRSTYRLQWKIYQHGALVVTML